MELLGRSVHVMLLPPRRRLPNIPPNTAPHSTPHERASLLGAATAVGGVRGFIPPERIEGFAGPGEGHGGLTGGLAAAPVSPLGRCERRGTAPA